MNFYFYFCMYHKTLKWNEVSRNADLGGSSKARRAHAGPKQRAHSPYCVVNTRRLLAVLIGWSYQLVCVCRLFTHTSTSMGDVMPKHVAWRPTHAHWGPATTHRKCDVDSGGTIGTSSATLLSRSWSWRAPSLGECCHTPSIHIHAVSR